MKFWAFSVKKNCCGTHPKLQMNGSCTWCGNITWKKGVKMSHGKIVAKTTTLILDKY